MKSHALLLLLVVVSCSLSSAYITEQKSSQNTLVPARRQFDLYANSRKLIEELIETLRRAAREAYDATARFNASVQEEAKSVRERVVSDIQKLRARVTSAIEAVRNRLIDTGVAIIDCIASHSGDANAIFNETLTKTLTCVEDRITEVGNRISGLKTLSDNAMAFGNRALEDMKKCTDEGGNLLVTGSCLGSIAVQAELRALVFATQSGLEIANTNLAIATLPATLEVCAASRLVDTGMSTAKTLMEIGTCSATSIYTTMTGNAEFHTDIF